MSQGDREKDLGRPGGLPVLRTEPASGLGHSADIPDADLPPALLAQLIALPEDKPADFTCIICEQPKDNRYNWSPRDYERPPICRTCESLTGYGWNGAARCRTMPKGGTWRDKREALRIGALADAINAEAYQRQWRAKHDRA